MLAPTVAGNTIFINQRLVIINVIFQVSIATIENNNIPHLFLMPNSAYAMLGIMVIPQKYITHKRNKFLNSKY